MDLFLSRVRQLGPDRWRPSASPQTLAATTGRLSGSRVCFKTLKSPSSPTLSLTRNKKLPLYCAFGFLCKVSGMELISAHSCHVMSVHVIHANVTQAKSCHSCNVLSCHSCQFMSLLSIHVIHVKPCHSCQFMSIHVNSCQFMSFMSNNVILVNSCQFMSIHVNSCNWYQFM
jgi:hypothetical protein